jgi:hypothetical protein
MNYNFGSTKFQYDFLNDNYEKLHEDLRNAIEGGRQIIVLMNSPYGRANEGGRTSTIQKGSANTVIGRKMSDNNMGACSAQLYAQFVYRLLEIGGNINICMFSTTKIFTGVSFSKLRDKIEKTLEFKNGFILDAKEFADVKSWALSFSIFKLKN